MNNSSQALAEQIRAFVTTRHDTRADLMRKKADIEARRQALLSMPLNRDDVKAFIFDYIDTRAAEYPHLVGWPGLFENVAYPRRTNWNSTTSQVPETGKREPLCLRDVDAALRGSASDHLATFDGGLRFFGAGHQVNIHTDLAAYFFFGDAIKAKIAANFDEFFPGYHSADEARVGPPIADRQRELAQLALAAGEIIESIASIDAELAELASPRETKSVAATPAALEPVPVPEEAILRYNGRNENELAKRYGCDADAILRAWHATERERRGKPSGQGFAG